MKRNKSEKLCNMLLGRAFCLILKFGPKIENFDYRAYMETYGPSKTTQKP